MDANDAASYVQDLAGDNANIIFGAKFDETMTDEATITVIATGLEEVAASPKIMPSMKYTTNTTSRSATTATRPLSSYTSGTTHSSTSGLGVTPSSMGLQRPKKPESSIPERDIKIPEFLKNTRK